MLRSRQPAFVRQADVSDSSVTLGGAVLFLIFGVVYSYEAWFWDEGNDFVVAVKEAAAAAVIPV